MMIPFALLNLIVSLYTLGLGSFVLFCNPKSKPNQLCFALTLASFVWLLSYGLAYSMTDQELCVFLIRIGHASAITLSPIVYLLVIEILGHYAKKLDKFFALGTIFSAFLAIYFLYSSPHYLVGVRQYPWGNYPVGGFLMFAYSALTFVMVGRILTIAFTATKKAKTELKESTYQRFKYYTFSLCIFVIACIDYLPKFGVPLYPIGAIFVAGFTSVMTYAIVRHKLLDFNFVIKRSFVYSSLISILTLIYVIIILLSEHIFRSYVGYQSVFLALAASCVIAFIFNPLRLKLQTWIDKYFYKIDPAQIIEENIKYKDYVRKKDHEKAVTTLAAGMAHEIKNPLTSIRTFAEYLPLKYHDPEFRNKFQRIVLDEVDRVNNIVRQVLDFSKPIELDPAPIRISVILEETLGILASNFLLNRVNIQRHYQDDPILVVDKNQLKQAFLNIILNSLQAMPKGGTLSVQMSRVEHSLWVSITDTGCGIPDDLQILVTEPFFTTKEDGTGLGLSIVQGIVQKHGGQIKISSKLKKGTTVSVILKTQS